MNKLLLNIESFERMIFFIYIILLLNLPLSLILGNLYDIIFLDELKTKNYEQVLIVAHSGVSKAFSGYFEGIKDGKILNRGLKNCEIKEYEL